DPEITLDNSWSLIAKHRDRDHYWLHLKRDDLQREGNIVQIAGTRVIDKNRTRIVTYANPDSRPLTVNGWGHRVEKESEFDHHIPWDIAIFGAGTNVIGCMTDITNCSFYNKPLEEGSGGFAGADNAYRAIETAQGL